MKPITDSTLISEVQGAKLPIVIKFEAKWCQPCKAMAPVLLDIEKEYGDRVQFYTANVEHCMLITQRYHISQIPALIVIENGLVTSKRLGSGSKQEIVQWMVQSIPSLRNDR
ncbi:thioredoxin family protein [Bradyrhizobium barranii subsp. apii]|uniref:thioredoxin family protein n=1 Tax=Bradyrhizobium barranii TaxID=2992140 RepID=UPI001AA1AB4D|nr:thioredoxin domain-containing protein [Bradyrhizobium barranii]UPT95404.1 thioredoxin family protein [Bradyrhizobium barranii subsp. apii]